MNMKSINCLNNKLKFGPYYEYNNILNLNKYICRKQLSLNFKLFDFPRIALFTDNDYHILAGDAIILDDDWFGDFICNASSLDEAKNIADKILIENNYQILSEEQFNKLLILL